MHANPDWFTSVIALLAADKLGLKPVPFSDGSMDGMDGF